MLVFATSMSPVAGWLAGVSIRWLRRPTARPCTCHPTPDTAPHSNWPLFPVPLPSLHADQDDDIATTSSLFNSTIKYIYGFLHSYQICITYFAI